MPKFDLTRQRLQILKEFDDDIIDQLLYNISTFTAQKHKHLATLAEEIEANTLQDGCDAVWLSTLVDDDQTFLDETHKLIYQLAIVALYKKIEITTRRALATVFPDSPAEAHLKSEKLNKYLRKKGIEIESLPNYAAMHEVRCLHNDIEQGGIAGKKLAAYPDWEKGETLPHLEDAYKRLAPLCASYLKELIDMLMQNLSSGPFLDETNAAEMDWVD